MTRDRYDDLAESACACCRAQARLRTLRTAPADSDTSTAARCGKRRRPRAVPGSATAGSGTTCWAADDGVGCS